MAITVHHLNTCTGSRARSCWKPWRADTSYMYTRCTTGLIQYTAGILEGILKLPPSMTHLSCSGGHYNSPTSPALGLYWPLEATGNHFCGSKPELTFQLLLEDCGSPAQPPVTSGGLQLIIYKQHFELSPERERKCCRICTCMMYS